MEEKEDIFKYGLKAGHEHDVKHIEVDVGSFFSKIGKPIIILLIAIGIFLLGYSLKDCPECEVCKEPVCPLNELSCSNCPAKVEEAISIRYACSNGLVVDDLKGCNPLNQVEITSPYKEANNQVTISIDDLKKDESKNVITEIDYTIINSKNQPIKPVILVNIYSEDENKSNWGVVEQIFDDEEFIDSNSWAKKTQKTFILYKSSDDTLRLVVQDKLDDSIELVRVMRPLK